MRTECLRRVPPNYKAGKMGLEPYMSAVGPLQQLFAQFACRVRLYSVVDRQ